MAELADALDLGSSASGREGSSPFIRILCLKTRRIGIEKQFIFQYSDSSADCLSRQLLDAPTGIGEQASGPRCVDKATGNARKRDGQAACP